jgi:HSP20 family molecular chaperone IbpA
MADVMEKTRKAPVPEEQTVGAAQPTEQDQALTLRPPADVFETSKGISILLDMPGVFPRAPDHTGGPSQSDG